MIGTRSIAYVNLDIEISVFNCPTEYWRITEEGPTGYLAGFPDLAASSATDLL
jgi:hypothetical protein